ncbi:uncharacterized protein MONOS_4315 [Monocercomonoides exilis]|uniref:uncharacterized protein n=1 Tax=Monocercomonoides exilis TaxID=2049356 RepID=UPI00355A1686|nr:hypothetical protein MONOS_4315 [Monocercomonoides exilis]|eukprot:MONOS_4315.1-p1 / transcript=MONOS_4315.1 / gene=MONOS_4315 / organism=Monocercomonoides_exilis_PA203 / gene_product=unspecified product / transcript_product=unspecified product / location=Mono_scaffold00113:75557-76504(-) / protein_length=296 / sequence_SO=supercontig / SO=protein_coding / is_pseudo=false
MRVFNISFHCLLKIALKKEENEEVQKEVEMSLLALSHIQFYSSIDKEPYLNEIKKIIEYHQEHYNLTRLAYQSAWKFLMDRYYEGNNSKWVIENELCFAREAAKELEDLSKCVDWKRKEEKMEGKEMKEVHIVNRWINVINNYLECCTLWNEELVGLIGGVVNVFRQAKDNYKNITKWCIFSFRGAVQNKNIEIDSLQKEGVVDLISEKMKQSTLQVEVIWDCLEFFLTILKRLKEKTDDKAEEVKRKANKKKMLEKLEEDGYEDVITSFHETIDCFHQQLKELTKNTFDYFVNA